ncbi:MAG: hypothetical protein L3J11_09220 [Draconibacterium sp.]|nr:hypothetical protein [Draconibacterium sp.]
MRIENILNKAIKLEPLTLGKGMFIYERVSTNELMLVRMNVARNKCRGTKWVG